MNCQLLLISINIRISFIDLLLFWSACLQEALWNRKELHSASWSLGEHIKAHWTGGKFCWTRFPDPNRVLVLQEDNGMPIHLKGGSSDALLYRATMGLTVLGKRTVLSPLTEPFGSGCSDVLRLTLQESASLCTSCGRRRSLRRRTESAPAASSVPIGPLCIKRRRSRIRTGPPVYSSSCISCSEW